MNNRRSLGLVLLLVFVAGVAGTVAAQDFPSALVQAYPLSVEKLSSEDVTERVSILKELVFHVPQSCTLALGLRFELAKDDYTFVVGKIMEKDLRSLDEKTKSETWTFLSHLITKFEMKEFAATVASYLDEPAWEMHHTVIQTLRQLRATELDGKLSPLLGSTHPYIRQLTLETLIEFRSKKAIPALVSKLSGENISHRYWALHKLAEIGAVEAGPSIAESLKDENENIPYWAIDTLAQLNAKAQAGALWQFLKENTDPKLEGFAIATLVQFEQKASLPLVVENLKAIAAGSEDYHTLEFIRKLKPVFLVPELISLYHTKTRFFASDPEEKRFRHQVLQLLYEYRSPLAIPVYRANLVDRSSEDSRPNAGVAELLYQMNAVEAVDDILVAFTDLAKTPGSKSDAAQFGLVLAKFGDKRAWKMLMENSAYNDENIFIELNKHLDTRLWDETHARKPSQQLGPVKTVVENLSRESGIPITIPDIPRIDTCPMEPTDDRDAIACAYSDPRNSLHSSLLTIVSILNNKQRGQYTFIYDKGTIRIIKTKDAVEFWKTNILNKG